MTLQVLKMEDVMALLKVSRPTIDRWCDETRRGCNDFPLPFTQRGRRLRWTADALTNWVERRQNTQPPVSVLSTTKQTKAAAKEQQRRAEATERALERHGLNRNPNKKESN